MAYGKYDLRILANGLRVVSYPHPESERVVLCATVRAGSRYRGETKNPDLAHVTEHMLFGSSEGYPTRSEMADWIEEAGGVVFAETNIETVRYQVDIPYQNLGLGLDYLSRLLFRPALTADYLQATKEIVFDENGHDFGYFGNLWTEWRTGIWENGGQLWRGPENPGIKESLQSLDMDTVRNFYKSAYTTGNIVLGVVGNFNEVNLGKDVDKYFASVSTSPGLLNYEKLIFDPLKKPYNIILNNKYGRVVLNFGFVLTEAYNSDDWHITRLLPYLLTQGRASGLDKTLRERALGYAINSEYLVLREGAAFRIYGNYDPNNFIPVWAMVVEEIKKLKNKLLDEKCLLTAIKLAITREVQRVEDLEDCAIRSSFDVLNMGKVDNPDKAISRLNGVTPEKLNEVCRKYLKKENLRVLISVPGDNLDERELEESLKDL